MSELKRTGLRCRAAIVVLSVLVIVGAEISAVSPATAAPKKTATSSTLLTQRVGFGAAVTGGAAASPVKVTDCGDDPATPRRGSLRALLAIPGARYVKWGTSCTTHLKAPLRVPSDTTLDGSEQAVTLTGLNGDYGGLIVDHVSNVIIHNLTITAFGSPALRQFNDRPDGIAVFASSGVWIDHNTMSDIGDKQVSVEGGTTDVTVSWNRFVGDAYNAQYFQIGTQFDGATTDAVQNVTAHHNFYDGPGYRAPSIAYGTLHQFNDVVERWVAYGVRCQRLAQCYLENDVFAATGEGGGLVAVKYKPSGDGCNDSGSRCDSTWGSGTVVDPYLPVAGTTANSSVEQPPCADPPVAPCSPYYGSGPQTFRPGYAYAPEPADATLQARVKAEAGSHAKPRW